MSQRRALAAEVVPDVIALVGIALFLYGVLVLFGHGVALVVAGMVLILAAAAAHARLKPKE